MSGLSILPRFARAIPGLASDGFYITDTQTGEVIALGDATPEQLGWVIAWLNEAGKSLLRVRAEYEAEVRRRMDLDRSWTIHAGSVDLSSESDAAEDVWDKPGLRRALAQLVAQGLLSEEGAAACWLTPKPPDPGVSKRGAQQLLAHPNPVVRDTIAACRSQLPKTNRPVKVTVKER